MMLQARLVGVVLLSLLVQHIMVSTYLMEANYFGLYPVTHIMTVSLQEIMILLLNNKI